MHENTSTDGSRLAELLALVPPGTPDVLRTLGFRQTEWKDGESTMEWDATPDYGFLTPGGHVIHAGLVTAILDHAMGGACYTVLDKKETFMTGDIRVEFFRPSRPGLLRAKGHVVRRSARVVFCAAELFDNDGSNLAASRCTQVVLPMPESLPVLTQDPSGPSD
jgi:uncharacterized protein (TIGR00369 family)